MASKIINSIGLVFGIIGVIILFIWGPPQPNFNPGVYLSLETNTVLADGTSIQSIENDKNKLKEEHQTYSSIGLGLIGIGFLFQIVSIWYPRK